MSLRPAIYAAAGFSACLALSAPARAQDLVFVLENKSSFDVEEFYASPKGVDDWEEDILGQDILPKGSSVRITIGDGRTQCVYDMRIVFEDGDEMEDTTDLCETSSYTVTD